MITEIELSNFRIFESTHKFQLAPITILVGPNNSGKSTLIKAVKLLSESGSSHNFGSLPMINSETNYNTFLNLPNRKYFSKAIKFKFKIDRIDFNFNGYSNPIENASIILHFKKEKNYNGNSLRYFEIRIGLSTKLLAMTFSDTKFNIKFNKSWFYKYVLKSHFENNNYLMGKIRLEVEISTFEKYIKSKMSKYLLFSDIFDFEDLLKFLGSELSILEAEDDHNSDDGSFSIGSEIDITLFKAYIEIISQLNNCLANSITYIPILRGEPKREYTFRDQDPFSKRLFNKILGNQSIKASIMQNLETQKAKYKSKKLFWFCNKCLKEIYQMDYEVVFERNASTGGQELLTVNKMGKVNIADFGYGLYQLICLLINIDLAGSDYKYSLKSFSGTEPLFKGQLSKSIVLVEEPELNLHPNYQSKLADVFTYAFKEFGIRFIIETHSEYLIRKFQVNVGERKYEISNDDVILYYFEAQNENPITTTKRIAFTNIGGLTDDFGKGFYDEALTWKLELLSIQNQN